MDARAKRLTIYIGESDRWEGQPLYRALLRKAREMGLAGATVFKGVEGFGAHSRVRSVRLLELSQDLPIKMEIVDDSPKIQAFLSFVNEAVKEGLVVLEDVEVVVYRHGEGPTADRMS